MRSLDLVNRINNCIDNQIQFSMKVTWENGQTRNFCMTIPFNRIFEHYVLPLTRKIKIVPKPENHINIPHFRTNPVLTVELNVGSLLTEIETSVLDTSLETDYDYKIVKGNEWKLINKRVSKDECWLWIRDFLPNPILYILW